MYYGMRPDSPGQFPADRSWNEPANAPAPPSQSEPFVPPIGVGSASVWEIPGRAASVSTVAYDALKLSAHTLPSLKPPQPAPFETGKHKYELMSPIGQGNYKSTFLVSHIKKGGVEAQRALSVVNPLLKIADEHANEVAINALLRSQKKAHPEALSCVSTGKYVRTADGLREGVLSDYFNRGDVDKVLANTTKEQKLDICRQMTTAILQLSRAGIVHRDIKSDNFLCEETPSGRFIVKVADFGKSIAMPTDGSPVDLSKVSAILAKGWLAPEIISSMNAGQSTQIKQQSLEEPSEVFQLGATLYQVLTESPIDRFLQQTRHSDARTRLPPSDWPGLRDSDRSIDTATKEFLLSMLDREPSHRPTLEQVQAFFNTTQNSR